MYIAPTGHGLPYGSRHGVFPGKQVSGHDDLLAVLTHWLRRRRPIGDVYL